MSWIIEDLGPTLGFQIREAEFHPAPDGLGGDWAEIIATCCDKGRADQIIALLSLARRVYAECGPELSAGRYGCPCTLITAATAEEIPHENCLWRAAEAILREVGEIQ